VGLRALARRLWLVATAPASEVRGAALGPLAQGSELPVRDARDRRADVDVADHVTDDQAPYGRGITLISRGG